MFIPISEIALSFDFEFFKVCLGKILNNQKTAISHKIRELYLSHFCPELGLINSYFQHEAMAASFCVLQNSKMSLLRV